MAVVISWSFSVAVHLSQGCDHIKCPTKYTGPCLSVVTQPIWRRDVILDRNPVGGHDSCICLLWMSSLLKINLIRYTVEYSNKSLFPPLSVRSGATPTGSVVSVFSCLTDACLFAFPW